LRQKRGFHEAANLAARDHKGTHVCAIRSTGVPRGDAGNSRIYERPTMDDEALNTSIRKFLKAFGVTAQREIEKAVRDAVSNGKLKDNPRLPAKAVVTVGGIDLKYEIESDIELA
jgi:Family of unknown function (DUF6494)